MKSFGFILWTLCLSEASFNCLRAGRLELFEQRSCEDGELQAKPCSTTSDLEEAKLPWKRPSEWRLAMTLSEIKQIKLLEQACEKASNGNELTCLIIHEFKSCSLWLHIRAACCDYLRHASFLQPLAAYQQIFILCFEIQKGSSSEISCDNLADNYSILEDIQKALGLESSVY